MKKPAKTQDALAAEFAASGFTFYLQFIPHIAALVVAIRANDVAASLKASASLLDAIADATKGSNA